MKIDIKQALIRTCCAITFTFQMQWDKLFRVVIKWYGQILQSSISINEYSEYKSAWNVTQGHMTPLSISCWHCLSKLQFENIKFILAVYISSLRFDLKFLCLGKYITLHCVSWTWFLSSGSKSVNGKHTTGKLTCVEYSEKIVQY